MAIRSHPELTSGRGAPNNAVPTRFGLATRETDGDWLDACEDVDGAPSPHRTTVTIERSRTIISRNQSPDLPFDRSINPYRGCEHGCVYCFARPTHAYHDLSPGLDFETRLFAKPDAARLLRVELAKPGYACRPIALGTNTDPYQPIEREHRITRSLIELLAETRHPLTITTKSDRVVRDADLLAAMAEYRLCAVVISITTLDPAVARTLEPRAPSPVRRLKAVAALRARGIPTFVSVAPVIPAVTDGELEAILAEAVAAGAQGAFFIPVRLPHEVAPLFRDWLDAHHPERAAKVMAIIQSLRGGRDNDPDFFTRMKGQGPWAALLARRFEVAVKRLGLGRERLDLRTDLFRPPEGDQLRLL